MCLASGPDTRLRREVGHVETSKPARRRDTEDRRREGLESKVEGFNERGRKAVRNRELHDSISLFTNKTLTGRNAQLRAHPDAPELREKAYRAKQETMANLDYYLSQMADAIEERGGTCSSQRTARTWSATSGIWRGGVGRRSSPSPRAWRQRRSSLTTVSKRTTPISGWR